MKEFVSSSFYNICLPLCPGNAKISGDEDGAAIEAKKIKKN
jgi:hypothetical protein